MAIQAFTVKEFPSTELNHFSATFSGRVYAQLPLADTFTKDAPCKNGMWLVYDNVAGEVRLPTSLDELVFLVTTEEQSWNQFGYNLGKQHQVAGDYSRQHAPSVGDIYTTNGFCYDTADFADEDAVEAALADLRANPLVLIPEMTTGLPQLKPAVAADTAATVAAVFESRTVPDGQPGIAVQYTKVAS